jgi:hypothetical protein
MRRGEDELIRDDDDLERRAHELYPANEYLRQQWLRGVRLVRTTARGWLLDPPPLPPVQQVIDAPRSPA